MAEYFYGITDVGRQRKNNEDAFIAEKVLKDRFVMGCVIDGVGGYEGGEVAARIARETILQYFSIPSGEVVKMMQEALTAANEKIGREKRANPELDSMACVVTLALVDVQQNIFYYAHVGDTRLYLYRDESLVKITKDHSFVGFLEDSGRLSEEAAMNHPKRNEINKALGFSESAGMDGEFIETGESPFLPGDVILLCSDGLSDLVNRSEMTAILNNRKTLKDAAHTLVNAANARGGKDNITVVLVQNNAKPLKQKATKPVAAVKKNDRPKSSPIVTSKPVQQTEIKELPKSKSYKTAVVALSLLSLLLLAGLLYLLLKKDNDELVTPVAAARAQHPAAQRLADSINTTDASTLVLHDSVYGKSIYLNDTLFIQKDSLHIKGNGLVLTADSAYNGPGLVISPNSKYILLDSLTLQNFDIGVQAGNAVLALKNVKFINCRLPVQYSLSFPDSTPVNGMLTRELFYSGAALPKLFNK